MDKEVYADNTKPAQTGTFALSELGVTSFFPIEEMDFMKPAISMVIQERPDGEITAALDVRMPGSSLSA